MGDCHWLTQTQDESMTVAVGPTDKTALQGVTVTKPHILHAVVRKVSSLHSIKMSILQVHPVILTFQVPNHISHSKHQTTSHIPITKPHLTFQVPNISHSKYQTMYHIPSTKPHLTFQVPNHVSHSKYQTTSHIPSTKQHLTFQVPNHIFINILHTPFYHREVLQSTPLPALASQHTIC
jgi:hypothetical protein